VVLCVTGEAAGASALAEFSVDLEQPDASKTSKQTKARRVDRIIFSSGVSFETKTTKEAGASLPSQPANFFQLQLTPTLNGVPPSASDSSLVKLAVGKGACTACLNHLSFLGEWLGEKNTRTARLRRRF
jgi:hypothetical protein